MSNTNPEFTEITDCHEVFGALLPAPVHAMTLKDSQGRVNVLPVNFVVQVSMEPVMVAVALRPRRFSTAELEETGEFVLNVLTSESVEKARTWGSLSGGAGRKPNLEDSDLASSTHVEVPSLAECVARLEFRVHETLQPGSHVIFIGELAAAHVRTDNWDWKSRRGFKYPAHQPLYYLQEDPDVYGTSAFKIP